MMFMAAIAAPWKAQASQRLLRDDVGVPKASADKGPFDDEAAGVTVRTFGEAEAFDQRLDVLQHRQRAADHDAVGGGVERFDAEIGEQAAVVDEPGDAAHAR